MSTYMKLKVLRDCDLLKYKERGETPKEVLDKVFIKCMNGMTSQQNKITLSIK